MSVKKPSRSAKPPKKSEPFPPLSTSLKPFLANGSDKDFRKMIYGLLQVSSMMLKAREYYGAYIGLSAPQYSMIVAIAEPTHAALLKEFPMAKPWLDKIQAVTAK